MCFAENPIDKNTFGFIFNKRADAIETPFVSASSFAEELIYFLRIELVWSESASPFLPSDVRIVHSFTNSFSVTCGRCD